MKIIQIIFVLLILTNCCFGDYNKSFHLHLKNGNYSAALCIVDNPDVSVNFKDLKETPAFFNYMTDYSLVYWRYQLINSSIIRRTIIPAIKLALKIAEKLNAKYATIPYSQITMGQVLILQNEKESHYTMTLNNERKITFQDILNG